MKTYAQAARDALAQAMRADARVVALGEDLGRGGIFGQYGGLADEFGALRVIDTPISEATIMGAAVGMALAGLRPVVEMRVADFALCAMDELVNQAAKARYMFGGQRRVPLVARLPIGIWTASAAQHSQSFESWFAHVPGLVVVAPATPADNAGLLAAAIACDDPVVYMEHKELWSASGEVREGEQVPLGRARVARSGSDVTLVTWSCALAWSLAAAETAAKRGISVEVIDLRTIWPWDRDTVLASCARTGRLLVVHESIQAAGFGAEVAAFLPFLIPMAEAYGWDLVWFGVLITLNVAIGACTPPTAVNLMVACRIAGIPIEATFYWTLWMVAAMTGVLLLLTFVPEITLFLPRALGYL